MTASGGWFVKLTGKRDALPSVEGACESLEPKGAGRYRLRLPHGPRRPLVALEARGQRMLMVFTEAYFDDGLTLEVWNGDNLRTDLREGEEIRLTYSIRRPYALGEKMTDRHPDSVIAKVVEETIEKQVKYLATRTNGIKVTADPTVPLGEVRFVQPATVPPELLAHQDRLIHATHEAMGMPADVFRGVDRSATPEKLSGDVLASRRRPDGFDQHQVDAAKAALLAPAPPRYPRTR